MQPATYAATRPAVTRANLAHTGTTHADVTRADVSRADPGHLHTVLIVDDHPLYRAGLMWALAPLPIRFR